ncbi:hypothetical protein TNCV_1844621 [Trichonephila clavipes]|nr:hypothetical protein TNCV_1844621 [Trichonephila clavipes]
MIASSPKENLCPPSAIFKGGKKRSCLVLDLVSTTDGQAVQTLINGFSPKQPLRVPIHRIQLTYDLRRRIVFQKQIFDESSIVELVQFHKNTHINSLKRLLRINCASKMAETLVSNCQQMN